MPDARSVDKATVASTVAVILKRSFMLFIALILVLSIDSMR
jgi:hypothetical protein